MIKPVQQTRLLIVLLAVLFFTAVASAQKTGGPNHADRNAQETTKSGAEILWDTWGVPHIFAQDEPSAFRAFGWAQMHNDGNVLLRLIAQGRGRGAEFYGAQYLTTDLTVRRFGLYEISRAWYLQQTPQFRRDLESFAAGINEYAQEHPEKLEPVGQSILPVTGLDILAHTTRGLETFISHTSKNSGGGCTVAGQPEAASQGSNGWTIGPSHSANGHAMLLANPHLLWIPGDYTFFEAQISFPGYNVYGAALLGLPVFTIAFNDTLGWTHTVNLIRGCDTYALVTNGQNQYELDGKMHNFQVKKDVIKVKQEDGSLKEEPVEIRRSLLGPVIKDGEKFMAVRVAGLQAGSLAGALEEWWEMSRAHNFAEFQAALQRMQLPMFNMMYADRDGHIELLYNGLDPVRNADAAQPGVLPGDRSALVWDKFYGYKDLPKTIDPSSGWAQNSNSVPWYITLPFLNPADYPPNVAPQGVPNIREQRGIRMLQQDSKISFDQLLADQYSTRCELADRVLNDLIIAAQHSGNPSALQAAAVLEKWDREASADSRGAFLFSIWKQKMGNDFFSEPFDIHRPIDTPRGLKDPKAAVTALLAAAGELQQKNIPLVVPWGNIFRLHRGKFDFPGVGGPEALGIFDVIDYGTPMVGGTFASDHGGNFMAEVEFSTPLKAKVMLTYGNSNDPASPHYGDQLVLLAKKGWRDVWRTRADLASHIEERTLLPSAPTH